MQSHCAQTESRIEEQARILLAEDRVAARTHPAAQVAHSM